MIDIRNIDNVVILSVPITESSIRCEDLMKDDCIQLSFSTTQLINIAEGAHIEYEGELYSLLEPYTPTRKSEDEYLYEPKFQSKIMNWSKQPLFYLEQDSTGQETDWSLTGTIAQFLSEIVANILKFTGKTYTYSFDSALSGTKNISFQAASIFDALTKIANEWNTEWWVKGEVIHLSKCKHSNPITLEVGRNIGVPSVASNADGYFTRFYAFGSTRNITQDYNDGSITSHITKKRLKLPASTCPNGYKDIRPNLKPGEIFVKILVFDDIYPSSNLTIANVRAVIKTDLSKQVSIDEIGNPIYSTYSIYYFQIPEYTFTPDDIIEGLNLSMRIESGALNGHEFELNYNTVTKEFEILFDESLGIIIPNVSLAPTDGDKIILFNIKMPSEYVSSSEFELEKALNEEILKRTSDRNTYSFDSNGVCFSENTTDLDVGQSILYKDGEKILETRVIKVEKKLDYKFQQKITIGEEKSSGVTQELKEEVVNINKNIDIIKSLNSLSVDITNAYGRTQKVIADGLSKWGDMWYFDKSADTTPDKINPDKWIIKTKYDLVSLQSVSAYGLGPDGGGGGGWDLIDNLLSTRVNAGLTANQGRILKSLIDGKASDWNSITGKPTEFNSAPHSHSGYALLNHSHSSYALTSHLHSEYFQSESWNKYFYEKDGKLFCKLDFISEKGVSAYGLGPDGGGSNCDIIDNLLSTRIDAALSANQGRILKSLIDTKASDWNSITGKPTVFATNWDSVTGKPSIFPTNWGNVAGKPNFDATYLKLTGGTLTGDLVGKAITADAFFANKMDVSFNRPRYCGIEMLSDMSIVEGSPTRYFSALSVLSSYVGFQLGTHGGLTEDLRFRKQSDASIWTPWRHIWHESNSNISTADWAAKNIRAYGYLYSIAAGKETQIGCQNSAYCHYATSADLGHWFNKTVYVAGDVFAGYGYGRRLAYVDEISGIDTDYASRLRGFYTGDGGYQKPNYFGTGGRLQMMGGLPGVVNTYYDCFIMNSYIFDVPFCNMLAGDKYGAGNFYLFQQNANSETWVNKGRFWHSGNANLSTTPWNCSQLNIGTVAKIRLASNYLSLVSPGDGICISGGVAMLVNYRADGLVPQNWYWRNGTSTGWSNHHFGNISANGNIIATGEITAYSASDIRLKTNLRPLDGLSYLRELQAYEFDWNNKARELTGDNRQHGFGYIAQDVQRRLPQFTHSIYNSKYLGVQYEKLMPFMGAAITQIDKKQSEHERRIGVLERENQELKRQLNKLTA